MTLDKAIKRNKKSVNSYIYVDKEEPKAIQLGIEALERLKKLRDMDNKLSNSTRLSIETQERLPSETE